MPYGLVTELNKPPSLYYKLTKGTVLEPWLFKALQENHYFSKPINIWQESDSMITKIARTAHMGFFWGCITGAGQGYFKNLQQGQTHINHFKNPAAYRVFGIAMVTAALQSAAFPITVSIASSIRGTEGKATEYYLGGLSCGIVALTMSNMSKSLYYSKTWNMICVSVLPLVPCVAKYWLMINEYDDDKAGRITGRPGGQHVHSIAEFRALYGIEPYDVPLEKIINKGEVETREMAFLKPRANSSRNDKFRVEE